MYRKFQAHTYKIFLREGQNRKGCDEGGILANTFNVGGFFTKPLMGELFRKLRSVIMGYTSILELDPMLLQSNRECVRI